MPTYEWTRTDHSHYIPNYEKYDKYGIPCLKVVQRKRGILKRTHTDRFTVIWCIAPGVSRGPFLDRIICVLFQYFNTRYGSIYVYITLYAIFILEI